MTFNPSIRVNDEAHADQVVSSTPPYFDHAFVTVSAGTLRTINECEFLRSEQFGRFAIRASENSLLGSYKPTRVYVRRI